MVGFHAARKKARVVSRAEGAVKQDRLCVKGSHGAPIVYRSAGAPRHISGPIFSASRLTAGAFGFLTLSQCGERPKRGSCALSRKRHYIGRHNQIHCATTVCGISRVTEIAAGPE